MKIKIYTVLFCYALIAAFTIFWFNGTGDTGDSILHYLFAKHAFEQHELFFNHWAKPLFVLLSAPFAQLGFVGLKVFNAITVFITVLFTYKTAQALQYKNPLMVSVTLIFIPLYYILTFSGLTEPLFAMFLAIGLFFASRGKMPIASVVVSFLPFVRSEGLILIGVFGLFFLFRKEWKSIPLLMTGHLVYSIAGYPFYGDFLWVFNKIPYARLSSPYGSGKLFHYAEQLYYILGLPILILFLAGIISIVWRFIKRIGKMEELILLFFGFLSFFVAHSLFWYLGIFASMGLTRVMIAVVPLIALIALSGFNFLTENNLFGNFKLKAGLQIAIVLLVFVFPFTSNPAAINWDKEMNLQGDLKIASQTVDFLREREGKAKRYVYAHTYFSELLGINHFKGDKRMELVHQNLKELQKGDVVIWENWFAIVEGRVSLEDLKNMDNLKNTWEMQSNEFGRNFHFAVFEVLD